MVSHLGSGVRVVAADVPVVRRRRDQPRLQRRRSSRRGGAGRPRRAGLHQRTWRPAGLHLLAAAARREAHRRSAARTRRASRRSPHDLHADDARGDSVDAGDRPHRRHPLGRLCRLRRAGARGPDRRQRFALRLHRRHHLSQGQGRRAQVDRRRRAARRAGRRSSGWSCGSGPTSRSRWPVRATSRWTEFLAGAAGSSGDWVALEANEPAFILATSGTTAKPKLAIHTPRRLPGPHLQHGPVVLRPQADRRLVVDVGHRLDRRPQLHRLRAAAHRLHDRGLRRRARLPARRGQLADRGRGIRRHRHLHVADRGAHADALRRCAVPECRLHASRARVLRRRSAEPTGLGLAAEHHSSRDAFRSSITCGRPRRAVRCSAIPTASG